MSSEDVDSADHYAGHLQTGEVAISPPTASKDASAPSPPPPPPNGGFNAWLQCANMFCLWFSAWGLVNSFGVFQAYYEQIALRSHSSSDISWIGSLQLCLFIGGAFFAGPLFDIGYLKPMLAIGTTLTVLGLMMTSICSEYWQFLLAQGVCTGLGMAGLITPCVAVVPPYFSSRRALAMGIAATGSSLGAIIFTIAFEQLQTRIGFGWATRVIAFIVFASLALPVTTMRKRFPRSPPRAIIDRSAFREPAFMVSTIATLFLMAGLYIPYFYIQVFAEEKRVMPASSADLNRYLIVFLNVGSFFGRLFPNMLADKIGPLNTIIPCILISCIIAFSWISVSSRGGTIAFCIFYGFFSGSVVSLIPVLWSSLTPDLTRLGTRIGMVSVFMSIGLLIGNPIGGALVKQGSFVGLQAFCGTVVLAAGALLVVAKISLTGVHVSKKV